MNILSFDTVTPSISIALNQDGLPAYERTWNVGRGHSVQLPPAVEEALRVAGVHASQLHAIAVGTGPGSYTGIRIGISLAKGMAMALGCPLVGVSTLEVVAYSCAAWRGPICAHSTLAAERVGIATFSGPWDSWRRLEDDRPVSIGAAKAMIPEGALVCGSGARITEMPPWVTLSPPSNDIPRACALAHLALRHLQSGGGSQLDTIEPNYLRRSSPEERVALAEVNV